MESFETIGIQFERWLKVQGYSQSIYYGSYHRIHELFDYCQSNGIYTVKKIGKKVVSDFIDYQQNRISQRTQNRLSNYHINDYVFALKRFSIFCQRYYGITIPIQHLKLLTIRTKHKIPLSKEEVKRLFEVTHLTHKLGYRDRCMLSLYYSCGLRRNEGIHVNMNDICFVTNQLHVTKGKGGKERIVPFTDSTHEHLRQYINKGRPLLQTKHKTRKVLLLNDKGLPIQSQSLYLRLNQLRIKAGINRKIGLHHLRHSVATHLMDNNMPVEQISKFLGHSSLQSTQIYTHVDERFQKVFDPQWI